MIKNDMSQKIIFINFMCMKVINEILRMYQL